MHEIGRHTYFGPNCQLKTWHNELITIGNFCSVADRVTILAGGQHRMDMVSTFPFQMIVLKSGKDRDTNTELSRVRKTTIGHDVWIGTGATILSEARVGHGAVVGAESVVHGRIPPYAVVSGNPAEVLLYRFPPDVVEGLLAIKWWDWSDDLIRERLDWLYKPAREFVEHFLPLVGSATQQAAEPT